MRKIYLLLTIGILTCLNLFSNNDVCIIDLRGNDVPGAANFDELVVCGKTDTLALQIDAEMILASAQQAYASCSGHAMASWTTHASKHKALQVLMKMLMSHFQKLGFTWHCT